MLAILAAAMLAAAPASDTVYTVNGGRFVGTVIEETPQGITVQLPDGTTRRLSRSEVTRIEYSDGSVSTPNRAAPPAQPPAYRPPPAYPAQPPPPAYRPPPPPAYAPPYGPPPAPYQPAPSAAPRGMAPLVPFYGSFGIGGLFLNGDAAAGIPMSQYYGSQLGIWLEGGMRLTPHLGLGVYLDLGVGDAAGQTRDYCASVGSSCTSDTGRVGVLLRHTFDPFASSTPWIAVGTGYEWGSVSLDYGGGSQQLFDYHGWEMLRLMGGVDLRSSPVFGFGLYAGVSFGRYSDYHDALGDVNIADERTHTTIEAGLRFTLFP